MYKKHFFPSLLFLLFSFSNIFAQSPTGVWKTIDDESGEARSYVEIFEKAGMRRLKNKSIYLTGYLEFLVEQLNESENSIKINIITPSKPADRGCQLSLVFSSKGKEIFDKYVNNADPVLGYYIYTYTANIHTRRDNLVLHVSMLLQLSLVLLKTSHRILQGRLLEIKEKPFFLEPNLQSLKLLVRGTELINHLALQLDHLSLTLTS